MRVIDLDNINLAMRNEEQFVLRCEEVFHDKISSAAATILAGKDKKPIVALTGPSGSGKTTTAMRLQQYLENLGVKVCMLSMDNFFLPLDQRPERPELLALVIKICFQQRRKQLGSIARRCPPAPWLSAAIEQAGITPTLRPEQLTVADFQHISRFGASLLDNPLKN